MRRAAEKGLGEDKELRDLVVTGPAAVLSPIAIFRCALGHGVELRWPPAGLVRASLTVSAAAALRIP